MSLTKGEVGSHSRQRELHRQRIRDTSKHGACEDLGVFTRASLGAPSTLSSARQGLKELLAGAELERMIHVGFLCVMGAWASCLSRVTELLPGQVVSTSPRVFRCSNDGETGSIGRRRSCDSDP